MLKKNRSENLNNLRNLSKLIEDMGNGNAAGYEYILEPGTNDYYIVIICPGGLARRVSLVNCKSFYREGNKWKLYKLHKKLGRYVFKFPLPNKNSYNAYSYILAVAVGILIPYGDLRQYPQLRDVYKKSEQWHKLVRNGHRVHINHLDGDSRDSRMHNLEVTIDTYNTKHGTIIRALDREYNGKYTLGYVPGTSNASKSTKRLRNGLYLTTQDVIKLEKWLKSYNENVRIQRRKNKDTSTYKIKEIKDKVALDWLISYKGYDSLLGPNKLAL